MKAYDNPNSKNFWFVIIILLYVYYVVVMKIYCEAK